MSDLSFSSSQTGKTVTAILVQDGDLSIGPIAMTEGTVSGEYTGAVAGTNIIFNQKDSGDIQYDSTTGYAVLPPGKTYKLLACVQHDSTAGSSYANYGFYNVTTSTWLGTFGSTESLNSATAQGNGAPLYGYHNYNGCYNGCS